MGGRGARRQRRGRGVPIRKQLASSAAFGSPRPLARSLSLWVSKVSRPPTWRADASYPIRGRSGMIPDCLSLGLQVASGEAQMNRQVEMGCVTTRWNPVLRELGLPVLRIERDLAGRSVESERSGAGCLHVVRPWTLSLTRSD